MKMVKTVLSLLFLCVVMNVTNAQIRYKHVPRVKVGNNKQPAVISSKEKGEISSVNTTTHEYLKIENEAPVAPDADFVASTTNDDLALTEQKSQLPLKQKSQKKLKVKTPHATKVNFDTLADTIMSGLSFGAVKTISHTQMAKWVMWMIICLVAWVVFFVAGFVGLNINVGGGGGYVAGGGALSYVFWVISGLAFIGAIVFLILGLTGIMS